jgi:hypothetical protein
MLAVSTTGEKSCQSQVVITGSGASSTEQAFQQVGQTDGKHALVGSRSS